MNDAQKLEIDYRRLEDLKPFPNNPRLHPKRQIEQLAASISNFGFTNPLLVDQDLNIIAGHGRLLAARKVGLPAVPCIMLHGLSEAQQRALRIADNKIAANAGWDTDLLRIELEAISAEITLEALGFSAGELNVILSEAADPDDEVVPAVPERAMTQPGDIWILGEHRVAGMGGLLLKH